MIPVAMFLCAASLIVGPPATPVGLPMNILLACTLMFQFRLWDDLNDAASDWFEYPERVLPRAASLSHFRLLLAGTFILNLALLTLLRPLHLIITFLFLNAAAFIWYSCLSKLCSVAVVSYHIVLIKYPVFLYLLSPVSDFGAPQLYVAAFVYLCFCVYEALHDFRVRAERGWATCLAFEISALVAVTSLIMIHLSGLGRRAGIAAAITAFGAAVLAALLNYVPHNTEPQREKGNLS
jgi:hypothetical protein